MIKLNHLEKFFNKNKSNEIHVINDITFDFPDHGMIALFGRSGCGKTTLLNVIGGLDKANSGSVFVEGQEMSTKKDELRNRYIGYIFQNYCLNMTDTCFDNVAASLRLCGMRDEKEIHSRVMTALTAVGMQTYFKRQPNSLSGGQQQRIAIARAIVKNPQIILADEPTGNLDEANTITIMNILKEFSKNHLVLLVTHEANLVDYYCDYVIELSDGKIVGTRENANTHGYLAKDKNVIYLGEYEKRDTENEDIALSYYGDKPAEPVKVRLINRNGVMYLKVDSPGVHVLDESSEVHLEEGVFEQGTVMDPEKVSTAINLDQLPYVEGTNYGKLFSLKDGIISGYRQITDRFKNKKSAKRLRRVMVFFAILVVIYCAYSGAPLRRVRDLQDQYNHKAVYVQFTPELSNEGVKQFLAIKDIPESGVKEAHIFAGHIYATDGRVNFKFQLGSFETYRLSFLDRGSSMLSLDVNVKPMSDAPANVLYDIGGEKSEFDILISKKVADNLLKQSPYSFVDSYDDLVGMICDNNMLGARGQYLHDMMVAEYYMEHGRQENTDVPDYEDETDSEDVTDSEKDADQTDYEFEEILKKGDALLDDDRMFRVRGIADTDEYVIYVDESFLNYYSMMTDSAIEILDNEELCKNLNNFYIWHGVVYSDDTKKTVQYLTEKYPGIHAMDWEDLCREQITAAEGDMYSSLFSVLAMALILSVCMYFVMKSVYMNRMKELGIYRAIGVSKKNLLYRSFVEVAVTTTLSVFVGYLIATAGIMYVTAMSKSADEFFYYPLWMKLLVLAFLYVICIFSGTITVRGVLRKTPAEILSKYDI